MTARTQNDFAARFNLWAGIGMTCCFVAASVMLLSGLAENRASLQAVSLQAERLPAATIAATHR